MSQTKLVEKIKAHFVVSNFFSEIHAVYGIVWKNILERDRPQMTTYSACTLHAG